MHEDLRYWRENIRAGVYKYIFTDPVYFLTRFYDTLSPKYRLVLDLKIAGKKTKEISKETGLPSDQIDKITYSIKRRLISIGLR